MFCHTHTFLLNSTHGRLHPQRPSEQQRRRNYRPEQSGTLFISFTFCSPAPARGMFNPQWPSGQAAVTGCRPFPSPVRTYLHFYRASIGFSFPTARDVHRIFHLALSRFQRRNTPETKKSFSITASAGVHTPSSHQKGYPLDYVVHHMCVPYVLNAQ